MRDFWPTTVSPFYHFLLIVSIELAFSLISDYIYVCVVSWNFKEISLIYPIKKSKIKGTILITISSASIFSFYNEN
jgi:hypothetical protein